MLSIDVLVMFNQLSFIGLIDTAISLSFLISIEYVGFMNELIFHFHEFLFLVFSALRVLKSADLILSEDTRHSGKLLQYYGIKTPLVCILQFSNIIMGFSVLIEVCFFTYRSFFFCSWVITNLTNSREESLFWNVYKRVK